MLAAPTYTQAGHLVWRTKDPALEARLRASWDGLAGAQQRKLGVHVRVSGGLGMPMELKLR